MLPNVEAVTENLTKCKLEEQPFHKKYMRFSSENNVGNFLKILEEFPKGNCLYHSVHSESQTKY